MPDQFYYVGNSMSRTIEIDLREMLAETNLPPAITAVNHILM